MPVTHNVHTCGVCNITNLPVLEVIFLVHRFVLTHVVENNIFDGLMIVFICITGILITRQYQITKRTNFLRMTQVSTTSSPSHCQ